MGVYETLTFEIIFPNTNFSFETNIYAIMLGKCLKKTRKEINFFFLYRKLGRKVCFLNLRLLILIFFILFGIKQS